MRIVLAAQPAAGHLNPILGVARLLIGAGHEAIVYTGSAFRDRVLSIGAHFAPLPTEVDFDLRFPENVFPGRSNLTGADAMLFDFENIFIAPMAAQFDGLAQLIDRVRPDGVVADNLFLGAVPLMLAPRASRPFVAVVSVSFLPLPREDGLPHGLGLPFVTDPAVHRHLLDTVVPQAGAAFAPVQDLFDAALRKIGVTPRSNPMAAAVECADVVWQGGVPRLDYPRANLPSYVRHIGAWPSLPGTATVPAWAERPEDGRRLVLVTQGTVANNDLEALVLPTMRALAHRDDLIVIGTTGGRDPAGVDLPANARLATYLPFDLVLPSVHALVTNGGYGTVLQALTHGVPMVVAGTTEDKPEIAARLEWSGAGINLKTDRPSASSIADAVDTLLSPDSACRRTAHAIAREFAALEGEDTILCDMQELQHGAKFAA